MAVLYDSVHLSLFIRLFRVNANGEKSSACEGEMWGLFVSVPDRLLSYYFLYHPC